MMGEYTLTSWLFLRAIAFIYFIAFVNCFNQYVPLMGQRGLLPISLFIPRTSWRSHPSLFRWNYSDNTLQLGASIGIVLSIMALSGFSDTNGWPLYLLVWGSMWVLYLSFVNLGQTFYSFGWESLLLETGFLTLFLGPENSGKSLIMIWLIRWVLFRIMLGAGLIKWRGDPCWRELTCLYYHYETQPMPNPISWYLHQLPKAIQRLSVLFNHLVELFIPFTLLLPPPFSYVGGILTVLFQLLLIISGNLSWLNYLTIALCISCFDDNFWTALLPINTITTTPLITLHSFFIYVLAIGVLFQSRHPLKNMLYKNQSMNRCYDPLHLVNTYGAFGGITKKRFEIIFEGTYDDPSNEDAVWHTYIFKGKPTLIEQRPPYVAPYHYRLDWLLWFAAMGEHTHHPWVVNFIAKLLAADPAILKLLAKDPFQNQAPPLYVRAQLYHYSFTTWQTADNAWWERRYIGPYLPALALDDASLQQFLSHYGWLNTELPKQFYKPD
jgi:hypothetical protein